MKLIFLLVLNTILEKDSDLFFMASKKLQICDN